MWLLLVAIIGITLIAYLVDRRGRSTSVKRPRVPAGTELLAKATRSGPLKSQEHPSDKLAVDGRSHLESGRGSAHAQPVEAAGGVVQPARPSDPYRVVIELSEALIKRGADEPAVGGDDPWIPPGRSAEVAAYRISSGMIYVGHRLPAIGQRRDGEPALIDPHLPVDSTHPDRSGDGLHYWPSYSDIPPASRAAYLEWLAGGRGDPQTNIGYVFLFFYGIERRLLADTKDSGAAKSERSQLLAEVERLLQVYGENPSFGGYAGAFIEAVKASTSERPLYEAAPPSARVGDELPTTLRVALAQLAAAQKPIPSSWAWSWLICHPEMMLRTPATRCVDECRKLFDLRYHAKFGDGMVIKPNKTKLRIVYRPASTSFGGSVELPMPDLPDVTALSAPFARLRELVERCTDDLDPYSRQLGRNPAARGTLAATALLPQELIDGDQHNIVTQLRQWTEAKLGDSVSAVVMATDLLRFWPGASSGKMAKAEAVPLCQLLDKLGCGIEPDVRFGGPSLESGLPAVLFRLSPAAPAAPSPAYTAATALLRIGAAVADADDAITAEEESHLEAHVESVLDLSRAERQRLKVHLAWLLAAKPGMTGLKKRLTSLNEGERTRLRQFLVTVAGADGRFAPAEITTLTKLYKLLGFAPTDVYSDVHGVTAGMTPPAAEPVAVQKSEASATGFGIPPAAQGQTRAVRLDLRRIEQKVVETSAVSALLATIFTEEEPSPAPTPVTTNAGTLPGLDAPHSAFVRALADRATWTRTELEALAARLQLFPDGAMDAINDAALERCGELLCEGNDPVDVNTQIAQKLLA